MGDLVISKRKTTKHDSVYDPKPYKVVAVYGTQIKGMREEGKHKTRDSQKWKRVQVQARRRYSDRESTRGASSYLEDTDIGAGYWVQGKGAGLVDMLKGVGAEDDLAGLDGHKIEDELARPGGHVIEGELAGPDGHMNKDDLPGPDGHKIEDELAGPGRHVSEDELAGPDGHVAEDEQDIREETNKKIFMGCTYNRDGQLFTAVLS